MVQYIFNCLFMPAVIILAACNNQPTQQSAPRQTNNEVVVGGGCDGCELMYVGIPAMINSVDTSAGWGEEGQPLLVTGKVVKADQKTPAPDIILYYWQTDNNGYYSPQPGIDEKAKKHGHIRGWVKTDSLGNFSIYTIRPAPYPDGTMPAHIHISVKEPDISNEYYIDDWVFDDDPILTSEQRKALPQRGGSGILKPYYQGKILVAVDTIVLGLNIPGYPVEK